MKNRAQPNTFQVKTLETWAKTKNIQRQQLVNGWNYVQESSMEHYYRDTGCICVAFRVPCTEWQAICREEVWWKLKSSMQKGKPFEQIEIKM